jgi:cyclophilin family peptidyl-prolyl cis-trans isomerase
MAHQQWRQAPAMEVDPSRRYTAAIETTKGTLRAALFPEDAPKTVNNFVFLARNGFYDGVPFHRVISGFMVQTGDPTGTGTGGPGYRFDDEPIRRDYAPGTLAMANSGPNTNGSQFFICHGDLRGRLPKSYTIFGQVTEGLEVVDQLANVPVTRSRSGENSSPSEPIRIERVTIEEEGA